MCVLGLIKCVVAECAEGTLFKCVVAHVVVIRLNAGFWVKVSRGEREWDRHVVQTRSALPRGGRCKGVEEVGIIRTRVPLEVVFFVN